MGGALTINTFLNTLSVSCLSIKERGGALTPIFNVYANGAAIPRHTTWLEIRRFLANHVYFTLLTGKGNTISNPYTCGICHGVDHPKGLCPFPDVTDWNGPGRDQNVEN